MQRLALKDVRIITLSSLGGALEFFEFTIYALFARYISIYFFSTQDNLTSLLMTFGVYTLGYFARPVGGILFGHLGDKYGRKSAFTLSILCMAIATLLIGCLPSTETLGLAAPILLIFLRLVQGFSVGGEIAGAAVFTAEHLPPQRRGMGIGLVFMSVTLGNTLGGIVGFTLSILLGEKIMMLWGWRIPFFIGFFLGLFSYFIRKSTAETPTFQRIETEKVLQLRPLITLSKTSTQLILVGFCLMSISSTTLALFLYLPTYLSMFLNFKITQSFQFNLISFLILAILTAVFGYISDFINRKKLALIGCICFAFFSYMAFYFFLKADPFSILIFILLIGIGAGIMNGCYALLITELFPANIRYSGMAVSFNLGMAVFGGLGPLIFIFLTKFFHTLHAPFYYLLFCALITAVALLKMPAPNKDY